MIVFDVVHILCIIVDSEKKDYDPVKASLFNSFTTVSAILLLMNSVFNVMVYTTRNKNFKGLCLLQHFYLRHFYLQQFCLQRLGIKIAKNILSNMYKMK